jgi:hypothetical protein
MNEQQAEQSGDEIGSLGAGLAVPNSSVAPVDRLMASEQAARSIDSPDIVPDQSEAARADDKAFELKAEATKIEMPKAEPFSVEGVRVDASKPDTPTGDAPQVDGPEADAVENHGSNRDTPTTDAARAGATHPPRELLIMAPGERSRARGEDQVEGGHPAPEPDIGGPTHGRRFAAMAAMLLLAVIAGAAGGALATVSLSHPTETAATAAPNLAALETSVGRIDADITALKAGLERSSNTGLTQSSKTGDRLERIEKSQAETAAKLVKLGDAVDKLRGAGPAAATPVAAATPKDVTGTVTTPAGAQALPSPQLHASPATTTAGNAPMTEVGRLPTIEGWVLRDVSRGVALIEGRSGLYEVFAGDPVPGLGRVDAIRKQDGRWVVVTSKGLIVAR